MTKPTDQRPHERPPQTALTDARATRRGFLRAAAALGAAAVAPTLWLPRRARAATSELHGTAKHLLILHADGGLRSGTLFNAKLNVRWNPHVGPDGAPDQPGAPGTAWDVGALFDAGATAIPELGDGVLMPGLPAVSNALTVMSLVDHEPGAERSDASHATARRRIMTGFYDGTTGLLSHIYRHHPNYTGSGAETAIPPVIVGAPGRAFGLTAPGGGAFAPLVFNGADDFRVSAGQPAIAAPSWATGVTQRLDDRFTGGLSLRDQRRVGGYLVAKRGASRFRETLRQPMLDIAADPELDPVLGSNALLRRVFGPNRWGANMALGVRMLQLGSPAVVVSTSGYDTHSNELVEFPPLARDLGRQLAGLNFLLARLAHPDGGTYLDHTLVVVLSEFARDNTEPATGYNSAGGSDHRGEDGSRHQALPVMGAFVGGGARIGESDAATMAPNDPSQVIASQSVLASLCDAIGVDMSEVYKAPLVTERWA